MQADQKTESQAWPTIAVVGVGFIGLPLAMSYTLRGCRVIGIDINAAHVNRLTQGVTESVEAYEGQLLESYLQTALSRKLFWATTDYAEAAQEASVYIVTVGIPIYGGQPSYDAIDAATQSLAQVVKPGDLILYRSTHVPGSVRERLVPMLQKLSPYEIGAQVHVAYAPERVAEGRAMEEFQTVDVLVGGIDEASLAHAIEVLRVINRAQLHPTSIDLAETTKVIENVQRDVNIAMVQEIAKFTQAAGLPTAELVRLANTHPRVNLLIPGAGVGGYCIPNAYYYLEHKARSMGLHLPILATARQTNDDVPASMLDRIADQRGWPQADWSGRKVAVLGLAMKNFSNDDRISASIALIDKLMQRGAAVSAYDPLVPHEKYPAFGVSSLAKAVEAADVIIVTIRQQEWDKLSVTELLAQAPACQLVFDACEALTSSDSAAVPVLTM